VIRGDALLIYGPRPEAGLAVEDVLYAKGDGGAGEKRGHRTEEASMGRAIADVEIMIDCPWGLIRALQRVVRVGQQEIVEVTGIPTDTPACALPMQLGIAVPFDI